MRHFIRVQRVRFQWYLVGKVTFSENLVKWFWFFLRKFRCFKGSLDVSAPPDEGRKKKREDGWSGMGSKNGRESTENGHKIRKHAQVIQNICIFCARLYSLICNFGLIPPSAPPLCFHFVLNEELCLREFMLVVMLTSEINLKQNGAPSAPAQSVHRGVN